MAIGVLAAIEYQARTGEGQFIEAGDARGSGRHDGAGDSRLHGQRHEWEAMGYNEILGAPYAPYGCYPCAGDDNWIIIAVRATRSGPHGRLIGKKSWAADDKFAAKPAVRSIAKSSIETFPMDGKYTSNRFSASSKGGSGGRYSIVRRRSVSRIHLRERGHIVETEAQPWGKITHHGLPGIPSLSELSGASRAVDRR